MSLLAQFRHRIGSKVVVPPHSRFVLVFLFVGSWLIWYVWPAKAAVTIVVNTTTPVATADGFCAFPEAVIAANINAPIDTCFHDGTPGVDVIAFNIPGPGPHLIQPTASLPGITSPMIVDGTTEPDYAGTPVVVLDGSLVVGGGDGLYLTGGGITIRGLAISNFNGAPNGNGIFVDTGSGYVIELNHIGTDHTGTSAQGNQFDGIFLALGVTGVNITNNLISGNGQDGIVLNGNNITDVLIEGNYIGTNVTGDLPLGNGRDGVQIINAFANTVGGSTPAERNIISGNGRYGVFITGPQATNNMVVGNSIGTDVSGDSAVPNSVGVAINLSPSNHIGNVAGVIAGGVCDGACNLISGNINQGIYLFGAGTDGNIIQSNYIGTDVSGTADLGNGNVGVLVQDSSDNLIGGSTATERNLISGNNWYGVGINSFSVATDNNNIQGNFIGTNISGTSSISNTLDGIVIDGVSATSNIIGGNSAGAGNLISGNGGNGITILNSAFDTIIQGNKIGVDATGTADLGNSYNGVHLGGGTIHW